jgi:hypothetical protein
VRVWYILPSNVSSFRKLNGVPPDIFLAGGFNPSKMGVLNSLLTKLGLSDLGAERHPIRVFLLDDDIRRHQWFAQRFKGDFIDVAHSVEQARQLLSENSYDAIFLDHDLHPEHYNSSTNDDERTGYAIASWLASNPQLQRASTILVHTRNADGAIRMVEAMRSAGRSAEYVPFPYLGERIRNYWKR